jgi:hypothetical protein
MRLSVRADLSVNHQTLNRSDRSGLGQIHLTVASPGAPSISLQAVETCSELSIPIVKGNLNALNIVLVVPRFYLADPRVAQLHVVVWQNKLESFIEIRSLVFSRNVS